MSDQDDRRPERGDVLQSVSVESLTSPTVDLSATLPIMESRKVAAALCLSYCRQCRPACRTITIVWCTAVFA